MAAAAENTPFIADSRADGADSVNAEKRARYRIHVASSPRLRRMRNEKCHRREISTYRSKARPIYVLITKQQLLRRRADNAKITLSTAKAAEGLLPPALPMDNSREFMADAKPADEWPLSAKRWRVMAGVK